VELVRQFWERLERVAVAPLSARVARQFGIPARSDDVRQSGSEAGNDPEDAHG
jgi:hypothetical protein